MDAVTYPDERVMNELVEHWLTTKIDVSEQKAVASTFGVSGIPVAVAVSPKGEILGRVLGFIEPEGLGRELSRLRRAR